MESRVVVTEKPVGSGRDAIHPTLVASDGFGAGTRIGECCHFDRLLVESRTLVAGPLPPTGVIERWRGRVSLASSHSKSSKPCSKRIGRPSTEPAATIASGRVALA